MTCIRQRYLEHYRPLVQQFVEDVSKSERCAIAKIPRPFFPAFGRAYETSALKLVIVGQDTRGWGDLNTFLDAESVSPGNTLEADLNYFLEHPFQDWGTSRQQFWGFAMWLLAALHGQENWQRMKQGELVEILDSFAWGNCNAVELYGSTPVKLGVPPDYWAQVRRAAAHLDRLRHLLTVLRPHVVLVMCRGLDRATYFEGCTVEVVSQSGRFTRFHLPHENVDVFHVPHPQSMNRIEGTDPFLEQLKAAFITRGHAPEFPKFLHALDEGSQIVDHLCTRAPARTPDFDKFAFVAWLANELKKRDTFMSVPCLAEVLNQRGEETNYGTEYAGERGTFTLVRSAYHRYASKGTPEDNAVANNIATAFRKSDFTYAYATD